MKLQMLLLTGLLTLTTHACAADWLSWRKVGEATLTWGPFTVYHSQLFTPDGHYRTASSDQALVITYLQNIDRDDLVEATREQWQAQGILMREPQSSAWLQMLKSLWPDVHSGTQLAFVIEDNQGQFWYRATAAEKNFSPLGPPQPALFSRSFMAIWLDPHTQYPELRQRLIGGEK
ncbi:hypothetical protein EGM70_16145 [Enterobacteriaceae bacterium 89]|nr:hypothetical protein [Enterobacteriaceae bacterium 89]